MADLNKKSKVKKVVRVPLIGDQKLKAEQLVADSLKTNPDVFNLPDSKHNVDDLTDYLAKIVQGTNRILPKEKRRYVMYLRKSTDDEAKQVRSLDDQETECKALADLLKVNAHKDDIFIESLCF